MHFDANSQINFISDLSEYRSSTSELFNQNLLKLLEKHFDLKNTMIFCFDREGNFLSWSSKDFVYMNSPSHPYHTFCRIDTVANYIFHESVKNRLSFENLTPFVYRATDILQETDYETSAYARFLQTTLHFKYSVSLPFGTNGFIHLVCYKTELEGDFTDEEVQGLKNIYTFVAHAYKTFKKYEHKQIIYQLQNKIISQNANAYIITDSDMHILAYNDQARIHMTNLFGMDAMNEDALNQCTWLPFLLNSTHELPESSEKTINGFHFHINRYDQIYNHGIIEVYYWIVIDKDVPQTKARSSRTKSAVVNNPMLTPAEQRVAALLCDGLTYQAIADELVVSYHTVKTHVQNIFSKYGIKSRHELYQIRNQDLD